MELTESDYFAILNRYEYDFESLVDHCLRSLSSAKCLVTGASGSLGTQIMRAFDTVGIDYTGIDIVPSDTHDVKIADITNAYDLSGEKVATSSYDYIFHFAAGKHAPEGEKNPDETIRTNILGTQNLLYFAGQSSKIIFSSTCKAIAPETVYGSTKLIGERLALNAGHNVARYYNVVESSGNVFEIWANTPKEDHSVTDCYRYFITARESLALTLYSAIAGTPGRFAIDVAQPSYMPDVYEALYGEKIRISQPRRGDRKAEPLRGVNEAADRISFVPGIVEIFNYHDA